MPAERRLATVLFTDIVGSTARAAELGDRRWRELLDEHDARVREELERFGGDEVNTVGDGFVAAFDDPERALQCACEIRDSVAGIGLEVRCGLHTGEVQHDGKTIGGIAVHIAARLVERAGPREILVSQTVRDLVTGSGYGFVERGTQALKGVPGEWRLFAVTGQPVRVAALGPWDRLRARVPRPSARTLLLAAFGAALLFGLSSLILRNGRETGTSGPTTAGAEAAGSGMAVLPFTVTGVGLEDLREGMVDLLSTNLDGLAGLRAIDSRTVLARWRESVGEAESPDLATTLGVARRAGAQYALVGSAVTVGKRARLVVHVYDARGGSELGRGQVEGPPDSIFGLVDRLSIQILRSIEKGDERSTPGVDLASVTTDSLRALRAYLEGEGLFRRSQFEEAVGAFEHAVEIDSTFALALYRLGEAYSWTEGPQSALAARHLQRAARLARQLPEREALLLSADLAFLRGSLDGLAPLENAVRIYPDDAEAWYLLGEFYYHLGGQALTEAGRSDVAFERAVELDSTFTLPYFHLVWSAFASGDSARAERLIRTFARAVPDPETNALNRMAFDLAFGDSSVRERGWAALDTIPPFQLWLLARDYFSYPTFRKLEEAVLTSRRRPQDVHGEAMTRVLFYNQLVRGQVRAALKLAGDPRLGPKLQRAAPFIAALLGVRDVGPLALLRTALPPDSLSDLAALYAGAYAADQGDSAAHEALVARAREGARSRLASADSAGARFFAGVAGGLEGYGRWRRGDLEEGWKVLVQAQREATGWGWRAETNATLRLWLGELSLELGRAEDAVRYLLPRDTDHALADFWQDPVGDYWLGEAYTHLGQEGPARKAYAVFVASWNEADPDLQPRVERARRVLAGTPSAGSQGSGAHPP